MKENKGRFKKGYDSRRHKFTRDDCVKGFWNAINAIIIKYPNAINNGSHIANNFLKSKYAK
jgi:hypothetical protein